LRREHASATAPAALEAALRTFEPGRLPASDLSRAVALMKNDTPNPRSLPEERAPQLDYTKLAERYRGGKNRRRPGMTFG
jgi:hypothetical protein